MNLGTAGRNLAPVSCWRIYEPDREGRAGGADLTQARWRWAVQSLALATSMLACGHTSVVVRWSDRGGLCSTRRAGWGNRESVTSSRAQDTLKRAISVIKTRASRHDSSTRQYDIGSHGITIGDIAQADDRAARR